MNRRQGELDGELFFDARGPGGGRNEREGEVAAHRLLDDGRLARSIRSLRGGLVWDGDVDAWRRGRRVDRDRS